MRYLLLLLCIAMCCSADAQKELRYSGSIETGLLMGNETANSFVFTTQGVAYKQYTFGVGSGIDFYALHSVPLFVDVKKRFTAKATQPFVQAAAGLNFSFNRSHYEKEWYPYSNGHLGNGLFAKAGGGLLFRAHKKCNIALSAGYSLKTSCYKYAPFVGTPWQGQLQPVKDVYHYNRWYIALALLW